MGITLVIACSLAITAGLSFRIVAAQRAPLDFPPQEAQQSARHTDTPDSLHTSRNSSNQSARPPKESSPRTSVQSSILPGERFPQTRTSLLSYSDLSRWSGDDLQEAINEMFARHGADFPTKPETKRHFQQFSWYHPQSGVSYDQIETTFSDVEKSNLKILATVRDSKVSKKSRR